MDIDDLIEEESEDLGEQGSEQRSGRDRQLAALKPWQFQPGRSGNPSGRPKGTMSMKEFAKKYLRELPDDEKIKFLKGLNKDIVWKMGEGQWQLDVTSGGEKIMPTPIIPVVPQTMGPSVAPVIPVPTITHAIPVHNSNQENNQPL